MSKDIREILAAHLNDVDPPESDLTAVKHQGRALRRRRTGGIVTASILAVTAVGLTASQLVSGGGHGGGKGDPLVSSHHHYVTLAAFNVTQGLRAFADPATTGLIHLGDRSYPRKDMDYLDTDASATPYGMVFFDKDQKPRLLGSDGKVVALGDGPSAPLKGFHPSSKMDSQRPLVAWTENHGSLVRVVVYNLSSRSTVSTRDVPCSPKDCSKIKVDGLDDGVAFVRAPDGTYIWRVDGNTWTQLGGPKLRVADVRNGTILWADQAPTMPHGTWRFVEGKIDAQLTFDGKNVLYWSNRLAPTTPGGKTIQLSAGATDSGWYTFDTDGSVLVAVETNGNSQPSSVVKADVFDCAIPSGSCTKIGAISTEGGDPEFIGDDM
jgi:hypothetical protein